MIPLKVTLTGSIAAVPGTYATFYWNADSKGLAQGLTANVKLNTSPIAVFGSFPNVPIWLQESWLQTQWLSQLLEANISFTTPPCYFGKIVVGADATDTIGNDAGIIYSTTVFVNAAPTPPSNFARSTYNSGTGQLSFTFKRSTQLEV